MVPLGNSHVILRTVWLKSLGPTLWDFTSKTLQLWREGRSVLLKGVSTEEMDVVKGKVLGKLL